jgi:hypothetical protein
MTETLAQSAPISAHASTSYSSGVSPSMSHPTYTRPRRPRDLVSQVMGPTDIAHEACFSHSSGMQASSHGTRDLPGQDPAFPLADNTPLDTCGDDGSSPPATGSMSEGFHSGTTLIDTTQSKTPSSPKIRTHHTRIAISSTRTVCPRLSTRQYGVRWDRRMDTSWIILGTTTMTTTTMAKPILGSITRDQPAHPVCDSKGRDRRQSGARRIFGLVPR